MPFILQWNCRGLKPNYQDLQSVIHRRNPIIICLQETKTSTGYDLLHEGLCRLPQRRALQHNSPWRCIASSAPQYPRQAAAAELTSAGSSREGAPRSPRNNCMFGVPSSWYITPGDRAPPAPTRAPGTSPGSGRFSTPTVLHGDVTIRALEVVF